MNALPPDEILSKLKAVCAELSSAAPAQKARLQRDYLELLAQLVTGLGYGDKIVVPLLDLVEQLDAQAQAAVPEKDRREGLLEASDELMARVVAVIDVLVTAGYSLDNACQVVTRQMIARGVRPPPGGDARAWRNVQAWRHKLLGSRREGPVWTVYASFKEAMIASFGPEVVKEATRTALWERRHPAQPEPQQKLG